MHQEHYGFLVECAISNLTYSNIHRIHVGIYIVPTTVDWHSVVHVHSSAIRRAATLFYQQTTTGEPPEVLVTGLFQLLQDYSNFRFVKTGSAFVHHVSLMISRGRKNYCLIKSPFCFKDVLISDTHVTGDITCCDCSRSWLVTVESASSPCCWPWFTDISGILTKMIWLVRECSSSPTDTPVRTSAGKHLIKCVRKT